MLATLAGLSILVVGDSHLRDQNYLLGSLHDQLMSRGAKVHTLGVCGSTPGDWVTSKTRDCGGAERINDKPTVFAEGDTATKPVKHLIQAEKPDLVVVIMGDTIGGYKQAAFPRAWAWQQVTSLAKEIGSTGVACTWVGPAWGSEGGKYGKTFERVRTTSDFLASNVAPCTYVDSLKFSKPGQWRTIDGQHFTTSGYKEWGQAIADAVSASAGKKVKK